LHKCEVEHCKDLATHIVSTFDATYIACKRHADDSANLDWASMRLIDEGRPLLWVLVIEWDSGISPSRIVGINEETVQAAAVPRILTWMKDNGGWCIEFLNLHPIPDSKDPGGISEWLISLHEASCVPWVSTEQVPLLYTLEEPSGK
jgi:hypothetical protein